MSDVVNTSTGTSSRGQDRPGSVPVPPCLKSAGFAPESTHTQPETCPVCRRAARAGHRCVGGRHQHHRSALPRATFDQLTLGCADPSIGTLAGHRGPRQELRLGTLNGDALVVVDHALGPDTSGVPVLVRRPLVRPRGLPPSAVVAVRRSVSARLPETRHLRLGPRQLASAHPAVPEVGQIVGRVGGGGRCRHAPTDTDGAFGLRSRLDLAADNERRRPVPEAVPVDADARRDPRQGPRPHNRDARAGRQSQSPLTSREASDGVVQRREGSPACLELRSAAPFDLGRVAQRLGAGPQRLPLGDLGALPQPGRPPPGLGQQLRQAAERRLTARPALMDRLVPQKPATMPPSQQRTFRARSGTHTVRVEHCLHQRRNVSAATDQTPVTVRERRLYLPTDRAGGFSGAVRSSSPRRCPTACTCSSPVTRSTASVVSSGRPRAGHPGCSVRSSNSLHRGPVSRRCGPARTSSPLLAAQPRRSSKSMSRTSATRRPRPFLPTAKAGGSTGAFR